MSQFPCCPNCNFNKKASLSTGAYFNINKCDKCQQKFCYECQGSNGGRECPKCGAGNYSLIGKVNLP